MADFVELFERGDFVELGLILRNEFKRIDDNRNIRVKDKYRVKYDKFIKKLYDRFDPFKKSEEFFKLDDWDINRLSFAIASDSVARGLKTSQIRKILNMSSAIYRKVREQKDDLNISSEITRLSYILAYSLGRHRELEPLARVLNRAISKLTNHKDYEKVHDFLQAVVAYHRLLGGRD